MNCYSCNELNEDNARFCKSCGAELTKLEVKEKKETYLYFGLLALMIPGIDLLWRINHKLFLLVYGKTDYYKMYETAGYKISIFLLNIISYGVPILIAVRVKNLPLKIIIIVVSVLMFLLQTLDIFEILKWNNFWYMP